MENQGGMRMGAYCEKCKKKTRHTQVSGEIGWQCVDCGTWLMSKGKPKVKIVGFAPNFSTGHIHTDLEHRIDKLEKKVATLRR